jgi:aspartate carbamoyltransferase regulatory subunit
MILVKHIEDGTVIDHIESGRGLDVLHVLGGPDENVVVLAVNVNSNRMGKKDILKMERVYLDEKTLNLVSLIAPNATVNIIKKGKVSEKRRVELPSEVKGVLKCINPECISNKEREPVESRFHVQKDPLRLVCSYCNKEFKETTLLKR